MDLRQKEKKNSRRRRGAGAEIEELHKKWSRSATGCITGSRPACILWRPTASGDKPGSGHCLPALHRRDVNIEYMVQIELQVFALSIDYLMRSEFFNSPLPCSVAKSRNTKKPTRASVS